MDKYNILKNISSKEAKTIISNILDKYSKYEKTGLDTCSNFLDPKLYQIAANILNSLKIKFNTFKTNERCEKVIIYFGEYKDYVTIFKIYVDNVEHRQILGTLFSFGLDNDTIGDIFVEDNYFYLPCFLLCLIMSE